MKIARVLRLCLALALLTPSPGRAQESPTTLTGGEFQCQNAFGRGVVAMANETAACLAECRTTPGRNCSSPFFTDAITADCLGRAQAAAQIPILRACAGADCPECYSGGNCPAYTASAFSQASSTVSSAISMLYCDDSFSRDGLTRPEQQCQRGLARAGGRFTEKLLRCFASCEKAVHRGTTGFSSCEAAFLDSPTFDPRTQRCVDRARATLLQSCEDHCQDPPDCFGLSCPQAAAAIEADAGALQPGVYCQEPGVCGDGQVTGPEVCDRNATPSGCGIGYQCSFDCRGCFPVCGDGLIAPPEVCDPNAASSGCGNGYQCTFDCSRCVPVCGDGIIVPPEVCDTNVGCQPNQDCEFCSFCQDRCGNGFVDAGEVCDRSAVASCTLGTACSAACDACNPTESGTEDLACDFSTFDVWTFQVTAGQNVVVRIDTTDQDAGFELFGSCSNGQFFSFGTVPCSGSVFSFCPTLTSVATSDATCSVTVEAFFCSEVPAHYRLDVSGTDLTLVTDDGEPASPSGAFVDASGRE